jgi:hypothetical protein
MARPSGMKSSKEFVASHEHSDLESMLFYSKASATVAALALVSAIFLLFLLFNGYE